jgi:hypothetical protein
MEIVIGVLFVAVIVAMLVIPRKKKEAVTEAAPYKVEAPVAETPAPVVEAAPVVESAPVAEPAAEAPAKKPRKPRKPKAQ